MNRPIRVLLVDDERDYTQALSNRLTRKGLAVTTAADGDEAYDALHAAPYDVVVLDINMPGVDGVQTHKAIRICFPEVPVILHTGAGTINEARQSIRAGAYDFLFKPVPFEALLQTIRAAVARGRTPGNASVGPAPKRQTPSSSVQSLGKRREKIHY